MDDSFVPVIPDIKDQNLAPSLPTSFVKETCPEPSINIGSWSWDNCSNMVKMAIGFMVICLVCLLGYIGYIWAKGDTKKEEPKKEEPKKEPDMDEIIKTRNLLKKRKEETNPAATTAPISGGSIVIDMTPIYPVSQPQPQSQPQQSRFEVIEEEYVESKPEPVQLEPVQLEPVQLEPVKQPESEKKDEIDEFLE